MSGHSSLGAGQPARRQDAGRCLLPNLQALPCQRGRSYSQGMPGPRSRQIKACWACSRAGQPLAAALQRCMLEAGTCTSNKQNNCMSVCVEQAPFWITRLLTAATSHPHPCSIPPPHSPSLPPPSPSLPPRIQAHPHPQHCTLELPSLCPPPSETDCHHAPPSLLCFVVTPKAPADPGLLGRPALHMPLCSACALDSAAPTPSPAAS